jgi:excinuclease ABC subunit A
VEKSVSIKGAREHNLKNISIDIPRDKFVVITGLSGSGKSSLAFDTVYAEGQRRYLESLSAYARQFLEQMHKPDVDSIDGLSPSISIEQKNISRNPRSTVGTVTEIYDYLRLLYARVGIPHCSSCGKPIQQQTVQQIVDRILTMESGTKFSVLAPIARGKKGEYQKELAEMRGQGFVRALIDGQEKSLSEPIKLQKSFKHDISIYVDRLVIKSGLESRLTDAVEIATKLSDGLVEILKSDGDSKPLLFSTRFACSDCGTSFPELEPRSFSFNSPHGACPGCDGLGMVPTFDPSKVVPDPSLSLRGGAIVPWEKKTKVWQEKVYGPLAKKYHFSLETPWKDLPEKIQKLLLFGSEGEKVGFRGFSQEFIGVIPMLDEQLKETSSAFEEWELEQYITRQKCAVCQGTRLKKEMLSVFVAGLNIAELSSYAIDKAAAFVKTISLTKQQNLIAEPILKEIASRLEFLKNVGLSYLSLSRSSATLSGGEAQRIRLATQIGSSLVGVLYILDEPSIGLHQRDNEKLIRTLENLRDIGNSVIVVEHDEETIARADHVIDIGPGAGLHGGKIVFEGTPEQIKNAPDSLTGGYLSGRHEIEVPDKRRAKVAAKVLKIKKASLHNLKDVDIEIPLGTFVCVTGVSGSGKSSLIIDTLLPSLEYRLNRGIAKFPNVERLEGLEMLDKVTYVDQSPIGRTPRSNPATYTGLFTDIRSLFSELPESKVRGYTPGRFSFNVQGGRCEACTGDGTIKISMHFLPDVYVDCEVCKGKRYNRETMEVLYRGKSIADVLAMPVEQAATFFERVPQIRSKVQTLVDVGLGYIHLGQNAVTFSGGEAQRIKLSKELNRRATGRTIYILDEPTTGLHFADVKKLLEILQSLVNQGNTVVVIEHNLDVIKQADYLIDLGPEGGEAGGEVVFQGTPEEIVTCENSYTGKFLAKTLKRHRSPSSASKKSKPALTTLPEER